MPPPKSLGEYGPPPSHDQSARSQPLITPTAPHLPCDRYHMCQPRSCPGGEARSGRLHSSQPRAQGTDKTLLPQALVGKTRSEQPWGAGQSANVIWGQQQLEPLERGAGSWAPRAVGQRGKGILGGHCEQKHRKGDHSAPQLMHRSLQ